MLGIKDKIVVITGASSGIGEATAVMLAGRGAKVVLGARGLDRLQGSSDKKQTSNAQHPTSNEEESRK
jgi:NADP-dependent 3-hydroxy acid dehydrogenase YdfG